MGERLHLPAPVPKNSANTGHHTEGLSYAGTKPEWFEYQHFDVNLPRLSASQNESGKVLISSG